MWRHEYRYGGDRITVGLCDANANPNPNRNRCGGAGRPGAERRDDGDDPRGDIQ
jgi:hypothetical protein